ncbi:MAG: metal-dependent transcriptional regulator [Oscillospiraceae bacterium]|jgi:Mn-dependent DtxR family transcriptional regulator|nr:metal-dependent transcriptional regulator [Oscillospiraceae bacterium]
MKMQESGENYLETILILKQEKGYVRSIDIAMKLDFSKPSVSRAMSLLRENGYITMDQKEGWIELTGSGREIAERIYERHQVISQWLMDLGVAEKTATADACRIEHVISPETFDRIKEHIARDKAANSH